jgi:hypothetical protein
MWSCKPCSRTNDGSGPLWIAERHSLHTADGHLKAARPVQERGCFEAHREQENAKTPLFQGVFTSGMDDTGLEPVTSTMSR